METTNKRLGIIIIVVLLFIFSYVFIYKNYFYDEKLDQRKISDEEERRQTEEMKKRKQQEGEKEEDVIPEKTQEQIEEEKKREEEKAQREYREQEEQKEKEIFKNDNLVSKLSKYGFKEVNDKDCQKDYRCFKNNDYYVSMGTNTVGLISFDKEISKEAILNYDCAKDFEMFKDIFEKDNLTSLVKKMNYFIRMLDSKGFDYFYFDSNRLHIEVSYYGHELSYRFSRDSFFDDNLDVSSVDASLDFYPVDINKINDRKNDFYNFLMDNNKDLFVYYDYVTRYFNEATLDVCRIDFTGKDNYYFESSYCHGGTSNTYFRIEKNYSVDYDNLLKVDFKGDYFRKNAVDIISNDLNYYSGKTGNKYELSDSNKVKLKDYINKEDIDLTLEISDSMRIDITYYPEHYYKNYYVAYIIK